MLFARLRMLLAIVLCMSLSSPNFAAEEPSDADFERLAKIFSAIGWPNVAEKPWVSVDVGPDDFRMTLDGWLIKENAEEILLIDWHGETHNPRTPVAGEIRLNLKRDEQGIVLDTENVFDHSIAWKVEVKDLRAKSRKFLADGLPKKNPLRNEFAPGYKRFNLADHIMDSARYTHIAQALGDKKHAAELYTYTQKTCETYASRYLGDPQHATNLPVFVAERFASDRRNHAISCANHGVARSDLQKQWEKIAAIPYHEHHDEAKAMGGHYRSLLKEDARWVEPDKKAFAKLTTEQKVDYWLYHLRDLDVVQRSDPGYCDVLDRRSKPDTKRPNPAVELKKLGMAAVPRLIAHLDDRRPTRCKRHWRWYWPEGHHLLTYADCCQQIFEGITGHRILPANSGSYPSERGVEKLCKENAEKWWREQQRQLKDR